MSKVIKIKDMLKNWTNLNEHISLVNDIKFLKQVLKYEQNNNNRGTFVKRIKQRINKLSREYDDV